MSNLTILLLFFLFSITPPLIFWITQTLWVFPKKYGKQIYFSPTLKYIARSKNINHSYFNFKEIDEYILNKLNRFPHYKDNSILDNIHLVLTKDLYGGYNYTVKAIGSCNTTKPMWWKKFKEVYIINMDAESIQERKLNSKEIANLFIHEYFHHWLATHKSDWDRDHSDLIWEETK